MTEASPADATAVIETSAPTPTRAVPEPAMPIGASLGRYLVIEELGRGGMGVVLRGYDPKLQREVALKVVRTKALGESAMARLVREARAMARLAHPNVVAVYDVEVNDDAHGVVMVMELVRGPTLELWVQLGRRGWREIVAAFVAAGEGLAAAHAEGLLHRDFKLANVLVGDDGRVRVTDFGLARAAGARAGTTGPFEVVSADESLSPVSGGSDALTAAGTVMGTPPYMAPEQAEGAELDARADQYAFCVALWRALTGRLPFVQRGGDAMLAEKLSGPPSWPGDVAVPRSIALAIRRGLMPAPADRWPTLPALLDALRRDPTRGRRTVFAIGVLAIGGLGLWGVARLQHARAVEACVDAGASVTKVFDDARANEIASAFATTGIAYAPDTWTRSRALIGTWTSEWQQARTSVCVGSQVERTLTPARADASAACLDEQLVGLDALLDQLATPDPTAIQKTALASASLPSVADCTDETRLSQRAEPPSDPQVRAQVEAVRARLSGVFAAHATGRFDAALAEAEAARADAKTLHWAPIQAESALAVGRALEARGRYVDATAAFEDAFYGAIGAGRDELAADASAALTQTVGDHLARPDEGLRWGRLARMLMERTDRTGSIGGATLLVGLARVHQRRGEYDDALEHRTRAIEILEGVLGPDHPNVAIVLTGLGDTHFARGEYDEALAVHARARGILETTLGAEHPQVAAALLNAGNVHYGKGNLDEAVRHYERALAMFEATLGPDHPNVAACLTTLGAARQGQRKYDDAFALHTRALAIRKAALGDEHPDVAGSLTHLGNAHYGRREFPEAVALWEQSLAILEKALGPEHPNVAMALNNLAAVNHERGEYEAAVAPYRRALAIREKMLGRDHPDVAASLANLALCEHELGQYREAVADFERALAIREKAGVGADPIAANRFGLARSLWEEGRDRSRARAQGLAARDFWKGDPQKNEVALKMIEEWLAGHP